MIMEVIKERKERSVHRSRIHSRLHVRIHYDMHFAAVNNDGRGRKDSNSVFAWLASFSLCLYIVWFVF